MRLNESRLWIAVLLTASLAANLFAQNAGHDQLSRYSLQIGIDDVAREQFTAADGELARGDSTAAITRWRALLDSPRKGLVPRWGTFTSVSQGVADALRASSPDVRREYEQLSLVPAQQQLDAALAVESTTRLWGVVDQFPMTSSSRQACLAIAERAFDAARFAECSAAVMRLLDQSFDQVNAVRDQPQLLLWQMLSLRELGDSEGADRFLIQFRSSVPPSTLQLVETASTAGWIPFRNAPIVLRPRAKPDDAASLFPSESPIWTRSLPGTEFKREWRQLQIDFETIAQPMLEVAGGLATSQGLLAGGLSLALIDPETGTPKWESGELASLDSSRSPSAGYLRAALGESIAGRMTFGVDQVYSVEADAAPPKRPRGSRRVVAREMETGSVRWTQNRFDPGTPERPSVVLGVPLERHGIVFVPVQVDEQLRVVGLNVDDGRVLWSTPLGDAGLAIGADPRRAWMPAVLMADDESLNVATGNGAVACLDPFTRTVKWVHVAGREDWRNAGPPAAALPGVSPRLKMWTGWREPVLLKIGESILWAGPESNTVSVMNSRSGRLEWSRPRGDALAVMADDADVLVIGQRNVECLNPADGTERWTAMVPPIAGTGFIAAGRCVLPLRSGGAVSLQLTTGQLQRSVAWKAELESPAPTDSLRSLRWTPIGILEQTPDSISLYATAATARQQTPSSLAAAGQLEESLAALTATADPQGRLRARLQQLQREHQPNPYRIVSTGRLTGDEAQAVATAIDRFLIDRRPETAVDLLSKHSLRSIAEVWLEVNERSRRRLRADVAAMESVLVGAAVQDRSALQLSPNIAKRLDEIVAALDRQNPRDADSLIDLLFPSDWACRQALARIEQQQTRPAEWTAAKLAVARLKLLRVQSSSSDLASAAQKLEQRLTPATLASSHLWPDGPPRVQGVRTWDKMIESRPIPTDNANSSDLKDLSIEVETIFTDSRFSGLGEDRPWSAILTPHDDKKRGHLRMIQQNSDFQQAWVIGPVVLFQSGTTLNAVLPLDRDGRRGASVLWPAEPSKWDMWGHVTNYSVQFLPRLSDAAPGRHPVDVDDFGRLPVQVGPVTSTWFCFRQFGRLVGCETATGSTLWEREPFDPDALAVGDDNNLLVVSPRRSTVESLDPRTGRVLSSRPLPFPFHQWRGSVGPVALLRSGQPITPGVASTEPHAISGVDLRTGATIWKESVASLAVDFRCGRKFFGVLEPGTIRLFEPATGRPMASVLVDTPATVTDVYAIDDPFAFMVVATGPQSIEQSRPPLSLTGSRRKPFVNGGVIALDPETLEFRWSLPLDLSVFPLDQPRDIPVLVIQDAVIVDETNPVQAVDRLRVFDKRTGGLVYENRDGLIGTPSVIERDLTGRWIEIRSKRAILRLDWPQ